MQKLYLFRVSLHHSKGAVQNLEIFVESTTLTLAENEITRQFGGWEQCHYQFMKEVEFDRGCEDL